MVGLLDNIASQLLYDPTQVGGGGLLRLFGLAPPGTAAAPTMPAPPVGQGTSSTQPLIPGSPMQANQGGLLNIFRPRTGLLGNSVLGDAVRGGLAGLGSSTGYTGLAALGQGAMGANDAAIRRQYSQIEPMLAGQQFQSGQLGLQGQQQQLASGNMSLAQQVAQYNIWNQAMNPGAPPLTLQDIYSDPQKLATLMSGVGGPIGSQQSGQQGAVGGPVGGAIPSMLTNPGGPAAGGAAYQAATIPQSQPAGAGPRQAYTASSQMQPYYDAFVANEGSGPNQVSAQGATGKYQIIKSTFDQYAKPGESYANEADRQTVAKRLIDDLYQKTGGDPARMAVGYFSGAGNIAPAGSQTPYIANIADATGTRVADYANTYAGRLGAGGGTGQPGQPGSTQVAQAGSPSSDAATYMTGAFAAMHGGMTPLQWAQLGFRLRAAGSPTGAGMIADAMKADPGFIYSQKALETQAIQQNTLHELKPGAGLYDSQGSLIGKGNPVRTEVFDPNGSGNKVPALQYPDGTTVIGTFANQGGGQGGAQGGGAAATGGGGGPVTDLGPYATATQKEWADRRAEIGSSVNAGIQGEQRLTALSEALKATQSGSFATDLGKIKADLSAVGLGDFADKLAPNTSAADVQIATKDAMQGVFSQIKSLVGSRVAAQEINLLATASANANLTPEANAKIISQGIGAIRYERDLYHALSKASQTGPVDPNDFEIQFQKDHPLQGYIDAAAKDMGPLKGMKVDPGVNPKTGNAWAKNDVTTDSQGKRWIFTGEGPVTATNPDGTPKFWKPYQ